MKNREAMAIVLDDLRYILTTGDGNICALGELITNGNRYSAHHVRPVRDNGKTTPSNIIPLSEITHPQFNFIECKNRKIAKEINDGFLELKRTRNEIIIYQLKDLKDSLLDRYGYIDKIKEREYVYRNQSRRRR